MAHKYSNFAGAFAALCANWATGRFWLNKVYDYADTAKDYADAGNYKQGIKYCVYAIKSAADAIDDYTDGFFNDPDDSFFAECLYWAAQEPVGDGVDMAAILAAMWDDDKLQTYFFVNYIDAMRASIWNIKIEPERLHELYRHFSE
ncbi:hypothetical protein ES703_26022 [subsurface metagenome]